jgi:hypothetical protein
MTCDPSKARYATVMALCIVLTTVPAAPSAQRPAFPPSLHSFTLHWGGEARSGPYPLAKGVVDVRVDGPDGRTPTYRDLESLQYHHHTRVAIGENGRIWIAYSGALRREGESGMLTEIKSSMDGSTWSAPAVVVAPASPFDGKLNAGRRISYPRAFVTLHQHLYLVAAIDQANGYGCCTNEQGEALVAARLYPTGSVGKAFRVSRSTYDPLKGSPGYRYDARRGSDLFALADAFGTWGGSAPGQPPSAWTGYGIAVDGTTLVEANTIRLSRQPGVLFRLWRDEGSAGRFVLYRSISTNSGSTWTPAGPTDIPNSPSETTIIKLDSGDIAVIGNALDQPGATESRDPLFLALFDGKTGSLLQVYAVRQAIGPPRFNDGAVCGPQAKPCGASYPGAYEYHGNLYISYSVNKQEIWLAVVPHVDL